MRQELERGGPWVQLEACSPPDVGHAVAALNAAQLATPLPPGGPYWAAAACTFAAPARPSACGAAPAADITVIVTTSRRPRRVPETRGPQKNISAGGSSAVVGLGGPSPGLGSVKTRRGTDSRPRGGGPGLRGPGIERLGAAGGLGVLTPGCGPRPTPLGLRGHHVAPEA
ncbi:unnamed protein product [Prorocentrum cordatum]|uniref:Uncharacterized protein n=1 Tax=Prorocentrum cordatum TaxID=2364126 RepID=A0ABN9RY42_9DINO|nr:unnamed protein product [Polarella glacialis]